MRGIALDTLANLVVHVLSPLWGVMAMITFLGIVFYAFRPKNKDRLQALGSIPLRDDDKER
jgi:cytochrome c oxidase cbb3-type subunit 4